MRLPVILAGLLAFVVMSSHAHAAKLGQGAIEYNARGSFQHNSLSFDGDGVGSTSSLDLAGGYGYSVSDLVQLGVSALFMHGSVDIDGLESASSSAFGGAVSVALNFETAGTIIPFLSASMGLLSWSGDGYEGSDATLLPSLSAGMRFPVANAASFNLAAVYVRQMNVGGAEDLNSNSFGIQFGVSIFPRGFDPMN